MVTTKNLENTGTFLVTIPVITWVVKKTRFVIRILLNLYL